jgi:D-alanine-D-alanine ligase
MPEVLVLHNEPTLPPGHPEAEAEHEIVAVAEAVRNVLARAGHDTSLLAIREPTPLVERLRRRRPAVVFNLFEGTAGDGGCESAVAGILEWLRVPYTGCPPAAMILARDKPWAKRLLRGAGLPTPEFWVVERLAQLGEVTPNQWPVIVKPALQDGSVGIDQGSVVSAPAALAERAALLLDRYAEPVLVETFIDGRELNATVVSVPRFEVLPLSEIVFQRGSGKRWPIVSYAAKWHAGSEEDRATQPTCPADVAAPLAARITSLAEKAFHLFGCRDYARIDLRVNAAGEPFILEVNPNPGYGPDAGLARALAAAGRSWEEFTVELVERFVRPTPASIS